MARHLLRPFLGEFLRGVGSGEEDRLQREGRIHWGCFASVWEAQLQELTGVGGGGGHPGRLSSVPTGEWALSAPQAQSVPMPDPM